MGTAKSPLATFSCHSERVKRVEEYTNKLGISFDSVGANAATTQDDRALAMSVLQFTRKDEIRIITVGILLRRLNNHRDKRARHRCNDLIVLTSA